MNSKPIVFFLVVLGFTFISCNGSSTDAEPNKSTDSTAVNSEVISGETTLPNTNCFTLVATTYEVSDRLGEINSTANAGQQLSIVISTDGEVFLEISYDDAGVEESWKLDKEIDNPFSFSVKLEYTDANHDDINDELVIWWNHTDGNNGIEHGFEYSKSGIIIFDVMQRNILLNLEYENHYASYSASENAETGGDDYHAKMAEDTEWEICSYYYTTKLAKGELILSEFEKQIEDMRDCAIATYKIGTYRYNNVEQFFELVKE